MNFKLTQIYDFFYHNAHFTFEIVFTTCTQTEAVDETCLLLGLLSEHMLLPAKTKSPLGGAKLP